MARTGDEAEHSPSPVGRRVTGKVEMVRQWGVYVNVGLDHLGYIDPVNIQDDLYDVGDNVEAYVVGFRERNSVYELRPKAKNLCTIDCISERRAVEAAGMADVSAEHRPAPNLPRHPSGNRAQPWVICSGTS